jgi:predicted O-methyltransferase YrrM
MTRRNIKSRIKHFFLKPYFDWISQWDSMTLNDLLKRSGYDAVRSIPTHMTPQEQLMLYRLAKGTCVEIGSYLGASACVMALALNPKHDKLYCVDTWNNETMPEGERDTFPEFTQNTAPFSSIITPLRGTSENIAKTFRDRIDFLFIDGDHSYDSVKKDVEVWFPHLNDRAVVCFHDTCGAFEGVLRVIDEDVRPRSKRIQHLPNMLWASL